MKKTITVDAQTLASHKWVFAQQQGGMEIQKTNDGKAVVTFDSETDTGIGFFISQLEYMDAQNIEIPYGDLTFEDDVPLKSGVPDYVTNYSYRSYDSVAIAEFISASARDLPRVRRQGKKHTAPIAQVGIEANWTIDELRATSAVGDPIDITSYNDAFRGIKEKCQRTVYYGSEQMGMKGFLNNENVTIKTAATSLEQMTGMDLVKEINNAIFQIMKLYKSRHVPNRILMPPTVIEKLTTELISTSGSTQVTAMKFLKENNYAFLTKGVNIDFEERYVLEPDELGAEGVFANDETLRIVIYQKDIQNMLYVNPIIFSSLAPQNKGLEIEVPCEGKISGTEVKMPLSVIYLDIALSA
jgi:hypothetical protein